jgi:hypothetical protein
MSHAREPTGDVQRRATHPQHALTAETGRTPASGGRPWLVDGMGERAGAALTRAPYAWLVATLAVQWVLLGSISRVLGVADDGDEHEPSVALTIGAVGLMACGVAGSLVLLPRFVAPVARQRGSVGEAGLIAWAMATAPFMMAVAATLAGGHQWVLSVGLFVSVGLLVIVARGLRRDADPGPT